MEVEVLDLLTTRNNYDRNLKWYLLNQKLHLARRALFVEKYLQRIRHIEFQLIRDSSGNAQHLFERECSIQRRHQKLIEISPSPVVDAKTRESVGEIAVRAAVAVDYLNAGTAEFLRDQEGNFYFIEINSRLQVEHPVTELITGGIDLVKLQISIAQGEEIPFKQEDVQMHGCAIECRINAEDPFYDFAPSVGPVPNCNIPYGPGVRVDTYLYPGCNISAYYDSLVAKLIVWGTDFDEARIRTRNALEEFDIEGVNTTIPLYSTIMNEQNFVKGELSTDYLDRFNLIDKMKEDARDRSKNKSLPAIAAMLLHSEYIKKSTGSDRNTKSRAAVYQERSGWN